MTKKDYILIAQAIRIVKLNRSATDTPHEVIRCLTLQFMSDLYKDNKRFDERKFAEMALGPDANTVL